MNDKKRHTILVIEDEPSLKNALIDKFSSEGFAMLEAKNGEEGLALALQDQPDLILIDIMMPKMDGMTMFKKLREANEWGKHVPVIILTNLSSTDEGRMKDVTDLEPAFYLVKTDWKIEDIVAKVRDRLYTPHS